MDKDVLAFISRAAHEIRTPLNAVNGILELLVKEQTMESKDKLRDAKLSMNYVINLLNTLLDFSKAEDGKNKLAIYPITKEEILPMINAVIKPIAAAKNIEFVINYQEAYRCFYADKGLLLQILFNLLSNAVKYTKPKGKISLDMRLEYLEEYREKLWFEVRDNGIGMSEDFLKRAFEPFQTEGRIETSAEIGLGLSITKELIERMGGTIAVESQLDKGSVFTVAFEVDASNEIYRKNTMNDQEEEEIAQKKKLDLKGKKILIAEDDEIGSEMAASFIKEMGGSVDKTYDGEEVVDIFQASDLKEYSLILMDLIMPLKDGFSAASQIRKMNRKDALEIPIVAVTGLDLMTERKQVFESGINALLLKPFGEEQMKEVFFRFLREDCTNEDKVE